MIYPSSMHQSLIELQRFVTLLFFLQTNLSSQDLKLVPCSVKSVRSPVILFDEMFAKRFMNEDTK